MAKPLDMKSVFLPGPEDFVEKRLSRFLFPSVLRRLLRASCSFSTLPVSDAVAAALIPNTVAVAVVGAFVSARESGVREAPSKPVPSGLSSLTSGDSFSVLVVFFLRFLVEAAAFFRECVNCVSRKVLMRSVSRAISRSSTGRMGMMSLEA